MALPLAYSWRNVLARKGSLAVTVVGVAASVMVFVVMSATAAGIRSIAVATGERENVLVLAAGAASAEASRLEVATAASLVHLPEVARNEAGEPLASVEAVLQRSIPKMGANPVDRSAWRFVTLRGFGPKAFEVRPSIHLISGRFPQGAGEIIVGKLIPSKLGAVELGDEIVYGRQRHVVVGQFAAEGQVYEGEIWQAYGDLMSEFDIDEPSLAVLRLKEPAKMDEFIESLEQSKRFAVEAKPETEYYEQVSNVSTTFAFLGNLIGIIMGLGAIFAGMNTMYATMSSRIRELGTLRALGFGRWEVGGALLVESFFLGALGGLVGIGLAWLFDGAGVELVGLAFSIKITQVEAGRGVVLAVLIGLFGGFLPARAAAKLPIVDALRHV